MSISVAVVDSTVQLEWEITKEQFDKCDFNQAHVSPRFNVKIDKKESKWSIKVHPRGDNEGSKDKVTICLQNCGQESQVVRYDFTFKTLDGCWPSDPVKKSYAIQQKRKEFVFPPATAWGYTIGKTEVIRGKFCNDKITIVATLVIYGKGQEYLDHKKAATNFVINSRSISDIEELTNVTLVCQGKRFKCHKNVLASMSSFFKTKFTNGNFSDVRAKVINIEDSTSDIAESMVNFLNSGLIPKDIDATARELIKLSTFYGIHALTSVCEKALIKTLSSDNVIETFIFFDKYLPTSEDRPKILEFFKANRKEVVASGDWTMFCTNHPNLVAEFCNSL